MAINFPDSPVNGDTHVVGNVTYVYDNAKAKWNGAGQTPNDRLTEGSNKLEINASNNLVWTGNSTERLSITSTGKLEAYKGISTTGKTSGSEAFTVGNGAGGSRFAVYPDGTAVIGGGGVIGNYNILLQNDGVGVFDNQLLIGLTTGVGISGVPADLNSTEVGRGFINISRDDTSAADHILFGKNGSIAASMGTDTTNTLVFKTGTTEKLRISSAGQIGLGGTNYGTSGQVITSNGSGSAPTWQDAAGGGGGAMVLISTNTFTSSTASIDFTGISGYSRYQIIFSMETSGAGTLRMRVGIDGTYDTGSNYNVGGGLQTSMQVIGGFSATSKHGEINIMNLNQTERTAVFTSGVGESNDGSSHSYQTSGGGHRTATAQNSITLFGSGGNLSSGVVALYGVKYS